MCIIIVKPYGRTIPLNHLQEAFKRNPDGAGVAYTTGRGITIKKGYFDFSRFWRKCGKYNKPEFATIYHFRIATHGGTGGELCHPFPLTSNDKDIKKLKATNLQHAVAHNGIFNLNGLTIQKGDSDTTAFIKTHLTPIYTAREQAMAKGDEPDNYDNIIESLMTGCRFAILSNNGYIKRYGKGWQEVDGIYYSNNSFKKQEWPQSNWTRTRWQGYHTPTQTPAKFTLNKYDEDKSIDAKYLYDWTNDCGYHSGCYWWQGERVNKDEFDTLYNQHTAMIDWEQMLEANHSRK